jgi:hypothetical protein
MREKDTIRKKQYVIAVWVMAAFQSQWLRRCANEDCAGPGLPMEEDVDFDCPHRDADGQFLAR